MRTLKLLLFCLIVSLGVSSYAKAAPLSQLLRILYVKSGGPSVNCTSWDDACDLQFALSIAGSGDQVWVAAGIYKPTTTDLDPRKATFQLETGVAIYGGFPDAGGEWIERDWVNNITTLSGNIGPLNDSTDNSYRVVTGSGVAATAVLDGFTITGGNANVPGNRYGGGMYNAGGNPTLTNVTFSGNTAGTSGGGIYNSNSSPRLTNVTFSGNSSSDGGGMYNVGSNPKLTNITFSGNSASDTGGGMYNTYSSPTLTNVTFSNNTASNGGGGMYNHFSGPTLAHITFSGNGNRSSNGGGLYNLNSSPRLTNVTFSGNEAVAGGGMGNYSSGPTLTNVTFSNNKAVNTGGGMYNQSSHPTVTNAIFWGNTLTNDTPDQIYNLSGGPVTITYSDIQGAVVHLGIGNINLDPKLGPLADNGGFTQTHALPLESKAIDVGDPDELNCPTTDQRGYPRPIDGNGDGLATCDMGAYEYGSFTLTVTVVGNGSVAKNPDKVAYPIGEVVTLTATADPGWSFSGWSGATVTDNKLTITGNTTVTANFSDQYTLSAIVDPLGSGTVTRNPSKDTYTYGTQVALTPTPTTGWTFSHWSGATVTDNKLTITGNTTVTANFTQNNYTLTVLVNPEESGTVALSPDQTTYTYGTPVTLTATANSDWTFSHWSGATGTANPLTMNIQGNTSITATFIKDNFKLYLPLILRN